MRPKKIILCVDHNEQDLSVLKFILSTNGYKPVAATNAQEAVKLFTEFTVDLVLLDHSTPHMSGNQLAGRLKQLGSHVPMILLGDPQKMNGEAQHADLVLTKKSCPPNELLDRIRTMSARKRGPRKGSQRVSHVELAAAS